MSAKTDDATKESPAHRKTLVESFKEHLPNPAEIVVDEIIHIFIQWYNRRVLLFSSVVMLAIPIYMITIGAIFIHSCPKAWYLPVHMIVCGLTSLIAAVLLISTSMVWKRAIKLTSKMTFHLAQSTTRALSVLELMIIFVSLLGVILLTIVVINISSTVELTNQTTNFCHPIIYYSSYALLFLLYTILSFIMLILFLIFHQYQKTQ